MLFRRRGGGPEVLLVHPGGPFWARKDDGAWSIPKGEVEPGEDLLSSARREFAEETGFRAEPPFIPLTPVRQASGKVVHAWAVEGDADPAHLRSNPVTLEWPPKSGRHREFPEVDQAAWFSLPVAERKVVPGQRGLLAELAGVLARPGQAPGRP